MQLYYGHLHAQYIQVMEFTYDIWYLMNRNQQSYSKLSPTIQKKWCIILSQLYLHDAKPTEVLRAQIDFIMDVLTTSHYEDLIKSPGNNHRIIAFFYKMIFKKKRFPDENSVKLYQLQPVPVLPVSTKDQNLMWAKCSHN